MSTSQEGGAALDELLDDALDEFPDSSYHPNTAPHIAFPTTEEETSGGGDAGSFAAKAALAFDPLARPIRRRKDQQGQHDEPTEMDRAQSRAPPTPGPSERDISDLKQGLAELMAELANAQDSDVSKMWQGVDGVGEQDGGPKNEMVGILQQLAESATRAASQGASSKQDGEGVNASIIDGLSEHLEQLEGGGEMQDVVDAIMRQLLAKDVLYQPLKEIRERYPAWLQENREKLSEEDRANYEQQYVCITKVCDVYEQEPDNFGKLMQLMQDMQGCGRPPQDIVDDLAPELGFVEGDGTDAAAALKSVLPDAGDCKLQ